VKEEEQDIFMSFGRFEAYARRPDINLAQKLHYFRVNKWTGKTFHVIIENTKTPAKELLIK